MNKTHCDNCDQVIGSQIRFKLWWGRMIGNMEINAYGEEGSTKDLCSTTCLLQFLEVHKELFR